MASYNELPIYKSLHDLILLILQRLKDVPKDYKYSLVEPMIGDCREMLRKLFRVNSIPDKAQLIREFIDSVELVKANVRILKDVGCIPVKIMAEISPKLEGISRQAYGWLRSVEPDAVIYGYSQS